MARLPFRAYCFHRATDQAFCTVREQDRRKTRYLGPYGTESSLTQYAAILRQSGLSAPP